MTSSNPKTGWKLRAAQQIIVGKMILLNELLSFLGLHNAIISQPHFSKVIVIGNYFSGDWRSHRKRSF
jgi:hypothetical protein